MRSGGPSPGLLDSEISLAHGAFWDERTPFGQDDCPPLSERANARTIRGPCRAFLPQSRRALEWRVWDVDGRAGSRRWLADSARRVAVTYKCGMSLSFYVGG